MLRHNKNIDDFEEFWKDEKYQDGYSYHGAKIAWNYQQQKIDRLFKLDDKDIKLIIEALSFYQEDINGFLNIDNNYDTFIKIDKIFNKLDKEAKNATSTEEN